MLSNDPKYQIKVYQSLVKESQDNYIPKDHLDFLKRLKDEFNFKPSVCYDIGSAITHWTKTAQIVWPDATCVLFDAYEPAEILYGNYLYNIGVLSDVDDKEVKFYQHDTLIGGNSYYRENTIINNDPNLTFYPPNNFLIKKTKTLDSIIKERKFPLPDLIKIDVQGAELDILKGAIETLKNVRCLIVELQHNQYNIGAPLYNETKGYLEKNGWICIAERFSSGINDGDYCFINFNLLNK